MEVIFSGADGLPALGEQYQLQSINDCRLTRIVLADECVWSPMEPDVKTGLPIY